ncbi:MAG: N-acetyltransferase, partial [Fervidicoccus fontis]
RGRGIAEKLVDEAVKFAKENELKIEPICSYAIYYFIKHSEKRDLLVDWMKNKNEEELKKIFDEAIQRERK